GQAMTERAQIATKPQATDQSDWAGLQQELAHEKSPFGDRSKNPLGIQMKLSLSTPGDFYEREADRIAEQVVSNTPPAPHALNVSPLIQRQVSEEEEEEIQTKASGMRPQGYGSPAFMTNDPSALNNDFSNSLAATGRGAPLSPNTRAFFEPRFGRDLSDIRIHSDSRAAELNQSINAHAFTRKNDIYFNTGRYAPDTRDGRQLLAHEMVHTFQQTGPQSGAAIPRIQRNGPVANPAIAGLPAMRYVDAFSEVNYDLGYRTVGGNLSTWLTVTYPDGAQIDIGTNDIADRNVDMITSMAAGHLGAQGRIFPREMTRTTVPRLWAARTEAIAIMEEYNYEFIVAALPAIIFIISLAGMPPLAGSSPVVRRTTRPRPTVSGGGRTPTPTPTLTPAPGGAAAAAGGSAASSAGASGFRLLGGRVFRYSGRDIVVVSTRQGPQAFYRRTGMGGSGGGGAQAGQWAPFDGILGGWFDKARYITGSIDDVLNRFGSAENLRASEWLAEQTIRHGDDVGEVFSLINSFLERVGAFRVGGT
ncbi:MAG: DUF4157 domain-containing protein, partial [Sneathiella sp.]